MREFLLQGGKVWILSDPQEVAVLNLDGVNVAVLLFTDEDLALTYAERAGLPGKRPLLIHPNEAIAGFLRQISRMGITHVVVDHTAGASGANGVEIGKAVERVEGQSG